MARAGKPPRRTLTSRLAGWLKSFSGVLTSLAAIVTATATIIAAYQTSRVHEQGRIIQRQASQLRHAQAQAAASPTTPSALSTGTSGGAPPGQGGFLSALQPTASSSGVQDGSQTMSAKAYPDSITIRCEGGSPDAAYDVAGNHFLTALVGIPDNTSNATGLNETINFASQDGTQLIKPVVVGLGSPARVRINITGVTQLQLSCTGTSSPSHQPDNGNVLTLGSAEIS